MKKLKPIIVLWNDATFYRSKRKQKLGEIRKNNLTEVKTTGFLIEDKKKYVTLAMTAYSDGRYIDYLKIPRVNIISIEKL